jgi:hypothetical protein
MAGSPLGFFLSLIWAGAVLATIVKGKGPELRDRILHARKAGEPWLHYWLSIPGAIGNLTILAIASVEWVNGGGPLRQSIYDMSLWWLPALLLSISLPVLWLPRAINCTAEWLPGIAAARAVNCKGPRPFYAIFDKRCHPTNPCGGLGGNRDRGLILGNFDPKSVPPTCPLRHIAPVGT